MKKFIHFGCWNQGFCNKKDNENPYPISKVMRQLDKTLHESNGDQKYDFIVIAGDNYYPTKTEQVKSDTKTEQVKSDTKTEQVKSKTEQVKSKTEEVKSSADTKTKKMKEISMKTIIKENLDSGFACLPDNIEINIILGNHDLETSSKAKTFYIENSSVKEQGDCAIVKFEQEAVNKRGSLSELDLYKHKWLGNNTLVLMIDTSMYDDDDASLFLPCYNVKTGKNYSSIEEVRREQQEFVDRIINTYSSEIKNVVIIGHHPISGYKYKNNKINLIQSFEGLIKLLYSIHKKLHDISVRRVHPIRYYYLCADLHLYQVGNITIHNKQNDDIMLVKQYIVGTGGTKLDDSPFLRPELLLPAEDELSFKETGRSDDTNIEVKYNMTTEQKILSTNPKYGFLSCELSNHKMHFKFIDTDGNSYIESDNIIHKSKPALKSKASSLKGKASSLKSKASSLKGKTSSTTKTKTKTKTRKRHTK